MKTSTLETTSSSFFDNLSSRFNLNTNSNYYSEIEEGLEEIFAEILGKKIKKSIYVTKSEYREKDVESLEITIGKSFNISKLLKLGYSRVERVWEEGEVSILGDVLLLWPFSMNNLLRISLFDNEVESIEIVDGSSRKKIKDIDSRLIYSKQQGAIVGNENISQSKLVKIVDSLEDRGESFDVGLKRIPGIYDYSNTEILRNILKNYKKLGYQIWYLTKNLERFEREFNKLNKYIDRYFEANSNIEKGLDRGFVHSQSKLIVLTDLEVLGEVDISKIAPSSKRIDKSTLDILKRIIPGDYLVHEDHGIGIFEGVKERDGNKYLDIHYAKNDRLLIPFSALDKVTKYIGAGRKKPKLTGLSSGVWSRISSGAKKEAESIAKELLQLYALRSTVKTPKIFSNDKNIEDFWGFVNKFEFQDTDDQLIATNHLIEDFKKSKPMDRLLVGDVGFGKTEIAMRAVFSVVNAGYQVAILAPTTVLVQQHLSVFKERFKDYPFTISSLSRLNTKSEREKVLSSLENGGIDIVIGTHSLLSKKVKFINLNLVVIDEEQKFGVKQKEHLKKMRLNTNILSMTATPIPRTLNLSLVGIRDISVLVTPPIGRKEIINEFLRFSWEEVERIINREIDRDGQIYYLHNRVSTIQFIKSKLKKMFPSIVVEILHGQMSARKIEQIMNTFVVGGIDVLLCTTIIENGLDIPNVNTLIVDDVNIFGLSQLYQIRGRIGRGSRQAYACFMFDKLKGESYSRLNALKEAKSLGSGYILSNRDLEIRGAGDILGDNQSGVINSIGYGLYTQMLDNAVSVLKS